MVGGLDTLIADALRQKIRIGSVVLAECLFPGAQVPKKLKYAIVVSTNPLLVVLSNSRLTALAARSDHMREVHVHVPPGQGHFPDSIRENETGSYINCYQLHKQWIDDGVNGLISSMSQIAHHCGYVSEDLMRRIRDAIEASVGIEPVLKRGILSDLDELFE